MRWGNYDTVNSGVQWNTAEASPGCGAILSSKLHRLPTSALCRTRCRHLSITTPLLPGGPPERHGLRSDPMSQPAIVGTCTGHLSRGPSDLLRPMYRRHADSAWASHVTSIPAQDCYLNTMDGPPDGTGGALKFDASQCYGSSSGGGGTGPASPTGLTATPSSHRTKALASNADDEWRKCVITCATR